MILCHLFECVYQIRHFTVGEGDVLECNKYKSSRCIQSVHRCHSRDLFGAILLVYADLIDPDSLFARLKEAKEEVPESFADRYGFFCCRWLVGISHWMPLR